MLYNFNHQQKKKKKKTKIDTRVYAQTEIGGIMYNKGESYFLR